MISKIKIWAAFIPSERKMNSPLTLQLLQSILEVESTSQISQGQSWQNPTSLPFLTTFLPPHLLAIIPPSHSPTNLHIIEYKWRDYSCELVISCGVVGRREWKIISLIIIFSQIEIILTCENELLNRIESSNRAYHRDRLMLRRGWQQKWRQTIKKWASSLVV